MVTSKMEVLVDLGPKPDEELLSKTMKELKSKDGVKEVMFKDGALIVETTLPSAEVLDTVTKSSGRRAVLQGFGETQSAVCIVTSQSCCEGNAMGVVRLVQLPTTELIVEGSVDGLTPGTHAAHVRHGGDLSEGCMSLGEHYNPHGSPHGAPGDPKDSRHAGDLGNIVADENGRATFRIVDRVLNLSEIIGRSIAITERGDDLGRGAEPTSKLDGASGKSVACGIIARSAGIFQNPKRICACDGVVVWDERDRPLAGKGRRIDKPCCEKEKKTCCTV